ncbi:Putative restriction endonuclease [Streptomyces zhaozhouensis]|uniref:Restriction endonuclease n=1 Tax=Streptomyces zhaozhouensis TaxID=1300267 RepID=A0A286E1C0_9ACTN|nr:Uma2 family endonuclease [Streptomyces zhaozhouensis]SOD64698.1 Putative restriction endonuclease [Streptomyces zhaozhouensis]
MSVEPHPTYQWPRPPQDGYVADDLDRLPNLPPHTELIDGSLVIVSPQTLFHLLTVELLTGQLTRATPDGLRVLREMTVTLGTKDRPEPDVMVVRAEGVSGLSQTSFAPEHVVLAVEVVSAESRARDRETKPRKYAAAGIPHFWRVEPENDRPVVFVHELEPATGVYVPTGIHREQLKLTVPFPLDIDLTLPA